MELIAILALLLTLVGTNLLDKTPTPVIVDDPESSAVARG
jgi:hypothetical protein